MMAICTRVYYICCLSCWNIFITAVFNPPPMQCLGQGGRWVLYGASLCGGGYTSLAQETNIGTQFIRRAVEST